MAVVLWRYVDTGWYDDDMKKSKEKEKKNAPLGFSLLLRLPRLRGRQFMSVIRGNDGSGYGK